MGLIYNCTNRSHFHILVLKCLSFVEFSILMIVTPMLTTKFWTWHNALANDSLEIFLFFSFRLVLRDQFCRFSIALQRRATFRKWGLCSQYTSYFMGTKRPMSPNSSCFIEFCRFHHPFASSCTTTNLSSTSSPTQITNHPLITLLILTNHTTPTSSPYQPQPFM